MRGLAGWYKRALAYELNKMGLRAEDLFIETPELKEALALAHPDVAKGRYRRLLRASDLTFKGKEYTDYKSADQLEPFKFELWETMDRIKAREQEYAILNLHKK
ncbi:hypothetical protein ACA910_012142 [Epithemia clementina (nom. ined.)]